MSTSPPSPPDLEPMSRAQVLTAMGVTAVVLLIVSRLWLMLDRSAEQLPLSLSPAAAGAGLGLGGVIVGLSAIAYRLWPSYRLSADRYLALVVYSLTLVDVVWLGLLPGLSEELLFRGIMLPTLGFNEFGIAISSLCFGILHYSGKQHWAYVIWATVIGAALGAGALLSGNLLVPVMAHITANLVSGYGWKLRSRDPS